MRRNTQLPVHSGWIFSTTLSLMLGACGVFQGDPAVRLDRGGPDIASRWNATLTTPRSLQGVADIGGSAWMLSPDGSSSTEAAIELRNAAPGGTHPWEIQRGRCGERSTVLGAPEAYPALEVGDEGRAAGGTTLDVAPEAGGTYHVVVYASPTNRDLAIACGNLAPPSN